MGLEIMKKAAKSSHVVTRLKTKRKISSSLRALGVNEPAKIKTKNPA